MMCCVVPGQRLQANLHLQNLPKYSCFLKSKQSIVNVLKQSTTWISTTMSTISDDYEYNFPCIHVLTKTSFTLAGLQHKVSDVDDH